VHGVRSEFEEEMEVDSTKSEAGVSSEYCTGGEDETEGFT